jgi:uncharacterized membrane protein
LYHLDLYTLQTATHSKTLPKTALQVFNRNLPDNNNYTAGVAGVANYFNIQLKDIFNNTITTDPKIPINVTLVSVYGTTQVTFHGIIGNTVTGHRYLF